MPSCVVIVKFIFTHLIRFILAIQTVRIFGYIIHREWDCKGLRIDNNLNLTQVQSELKSGVAVGISNDLWGAKQARKASKGPRHGATLSQWLGSGYFEEYFDGGYATD